MTQQLNRLWMMVLLAGCPGSQQPPAVSISPMNPTLGYGESIRFSATVSGLNDQSVTWRVVDSAGMTNSIGGAIDSDGRYTAPTSAGSFFIEARSVSFPQAFGQTQVNVIRGSGGGSAGGGEAGGNPAGGGAAGGNASGGNAAGGSAAGGNAAGGNNAGGLASPRVGDPCTGDAMCRVNLGPTATCRTGAPGGDCGRPCQNNSECSPTGQDHPATGVCVNTGSTGECYRGCLTPGLGQSTCRAGYVCETLFSNGTPLSTGFCLPPCQTPGFGCGTNMSGQPITCLPSGYCDPGGGADGGAAGGSAGGGAAGGSAGGTGGGAPINARLVVLSAPSNGLTNERLAAPVVVAVLTGGSGTMGTGVSGVTVTFSGANGATPLTSSATTIASGAATSLVVLGRQPGAQTITASATVSGMPLSASIPLMATLPPDRALVPLLNRSRTMSGTVSGIPGHGTEATGGYINGMAVSSTGVVYLATRSGCSISRIDTNGRITDLTGTQCSNTGDQGPASASTVNSARALTLSPDGTKLAFVTQSPSAAGFFVRMIDFASSQMSTLAGGGSATAPGYGDNGLALAARLVSVPKLLFSSDGTTLHILDAGAGRVRSVNLQTGIITAEPRLTESGTCVGNQPASVNDLIAADSNGDLIVNITTCRFGNTLALVPPTGAVRQLTLDQQTGSYAPNQSALSRQPSTSTASGGAPAGNLIFGDGQNRVLLVDGVTSTISSPCGNNMAGPVATDFSDCATSTWPSSAVEIASDASGNLYVLDQSAYTVSVAIRALPTAPTTLSIATTGGNNQMLRSSEASSPLLTTVRQTPSMAVRQNVRVVFETTSPGTGFYQPTTYSFSTGVASAIARASLAPGPISITATIRSLRGAPVASTMFTMNSDLPAPGVVYGLINSDRGSGQTPLPVPGPFFVTNPTGIAVATDGSVYTVTQAGPLASRGIARLSPNGVVSLFAQYNISFNILAIDETRGRLYVSRTSAIDQIDLSTGAVSPYAGDGSGPSTVGSAAAGASINADQLWVDANGRLYFSRANPLRFIDPTSGLIGELSVTNPVATSGPCSGIPLVVMSSAQYGSAEGGASSVYFVTSARRQVSGCPAEWALVRRESNGTLTSVFGMPQSAGNDITSDGSGGVFIIDSSLASLGRILRYTPTGGFAQFAFGGTQPYADFVAATSISPNAVSIQNMAARNGRLVFALDSNSVRAIRY